MTADPRPFELFHRIADRSSAKVRGAIVERGFEDLVRFRNVEYDEPRADLAARGGADVPALWDGVRLVTGAEAIIARLIAHADVGRSP